MFKRYLIKRKVDKAHEEACREDDYHTEVLKADQKLKDKEKEMLSKPCPINNMSKCDSKCVHYQKGYSYNWTFIEKVHVIVELPLCKLWRSKQ